MSIAYGRAKARSGEPTGPAFRLRGPSLNRVHQKGVDAAEAESPEHAASEGAAAFAGDEDIGASGAFGEGEIAVFLDDKLAADGNHEENTEPATEKSEWKDARKRKVGAEAQKDERGKREHDTGGERFASRAGGLENVVFKDGGAAKWAKDADGEDRNGDRSGNGETGAQADVDRHGAEKQPEERAENYRANGEFFWAFFGGYVGAEFTWRCRGTPWTFAQRILPFIGIECQCDLCGRIIPHCVQARRRSVGVGRESKAKLTRMMHKSTGHRENQKAQLLRGGGQ